MAKKRKAKAKRQPQAYVPSSSDFYRASTLSRAYFGAEAIVAEIIAEMTVTAASLGKTFQTGALDEWRGKLLVAVIFKLAGGGNWAADGPNVKIVARDMTVIAGLLSGPMVNISKPRAHAAFRSCKDHQTCPVLGGSGAWCNFDI